jgi:Ricin-type beta-trefoil lectin domain-like
MRFRRFTAPLFASAMAIGLCFGVAGAAQAAPTPDPTTWSEIYPPFFNTAAHKCLDVPSGSNSIGLHLQLYHCHGYSSNGGPQQWNFIPVGSNLYLIYNVASGRCMQDLDPQDVVQDACLAIDAEEWQITSTPYDPNLFLLQSYEWPSWCLAAVNTSGNDGTALQVVNCDFSANFGPGLAEQLFALG